MEASVSWIVRAFAKAIVVATLSIGQSVWAQDIAAPESTVGNDLGQPAIYQDIPQFGGPSSVAGQLAEDTNGAPQFRPQRFVCDQWLPFFRFGYADGDAALMQTSFSTGLGYQRENRDVAGIGVSWGKPGDGALRDQFTSEIFYRFQMTEFLATTPDIQLIVDPALNPTTDVLAFFGIRLRAAF